MKTRKCAHEGQEKFKHGFLIVAFDIAFFRKTLINLNWNIYINIASLKWPKKKSVYVISIKSSFPLIPNTIILITLKNVQKF